MRLSGDAMRVSIARSVGVYCAGIALCLLAKAAVGCLGKSGEDHFLSVLGRVVGHLGTRPRLAD